MKLNEIIKVLPDHNRLIASDYISIRNIWLQEGRKAKFPIATLCYSKEDVKDSQRKLAHAHALAMAYNNTFVQNINPEKVLSMKEQLLALKNKVREVDGNYRIEMDKECFDELKHLLNSIKIK
ncbi:MAG: hypothetical protein R2800_10025 [Flavipsychrobacter sp.]